MDANKAALAAGYKSGNYGNQLTRNPQIQAAISKAITQRFYEHRIDSARVLEELGCMAFYDPAKLFNEEGNLLPIHQIDEATRRAIVGVDITQKEDEDGNVKTTAKIRLGDKLGALTILAKHLQLLQEKVKHEHEVSDEAAVLAKLLANVEGHNNVVDVEPLEGETPPCLTSESLDE